MIVFPAVFTQLWKGEGRGIHTEGTTCWAPTHDACRTWVGTVEPCAHLPNVGYSSSVRICVIVCGPFQLCFLSILPHWLCTSVLPHIHSPCLLFLVLPSWEYSEMAATLGVPMTSFQLPLSSKLQTSVPAYPLQLN